MRMLLIYILFVAFGCQQTTFLETENLKTSKSEKVLKIFQVFNFSDSQIQKDSQVFNFSDSKKSSQFFSFSDSQVLSSSDSQVLSFSDSQFFSSSASQVLSSSDSQAFSFSDSQFLSFSASQVLSFSDSQIQYYESQIRLADSLYKNYLPQYNFDEVKAAMEFFDSCQLSAISRQRWRLFGKKTDEGNRLIAESRQLTAAKAHYYHAVGLTERDDIVGACEHYFKALEIMETELETENLKTSKSEKVLKIFQVFNFSDSQIQKDSQFLRFSDSQILNNPEDYEKIRFLALTYTRLGRLFYDENYCDLAMLKYKKALKYCNIIDDTISISYTYKTIGNVYQLLDKTDSALYHYRKSLEIYSGQTNKLDIEKSIAQILFDKGEREGAYTLIKNNLDKIENYGSKYSYYATLGDMYFQDNIYDSALYYLETCMDNNIIERKLAFTTTLSAIYDSIGNYEKRAYYDNISSILFKNIINKGVERAKLQVLYDNYNERKNEREISIAKIKTRKLIITTGLGVLVIIVFILICIKYMHRKQNNKLKSKIYDYVNRIENYSKDIENKKIIINQKEKLINDYQITNDKKDKIIDKQKKEIDRIKTRLSKRNVNIEAYYTSDICKKIVERKDRDLSCLKEDELALLLKSADEHLDNISERLHNSFSGLNKNDIYTICLLILNIEKGKLQYLLGKDRKTIWNRLNKIKRLMNVDKNHDLFLYIKENFLN